MNAFDPETDASPADPALSPDTPLRGADAAEAQRLEALLAGEAPSAGEPNGHEEGLAAELQRLRHAALPTAADEAAAVRVQTAFFAALEQDQATEPEVSSALARSGLAGDWARTLSNRPLVRLAAASLLVHLLALPVFAWWIASQRPPSSVQLSFSPAQKRTIESPERPERGPLTPADLGLEDLEGLTLLEPSEFRRRTRLGLASIEVPIPAQVGTEGDLERAVRAWLESGDGPQDTEDAEPRVVLVQLAAALDEDARTRENSSLGTSEVRMRLARAAGLPDATLSAPLQAVRMALLMRARLQGLELPDAYWKPKAPSGVEPRAALALATWDRRPVLLEVARSLERSRTESEPWRTWLEWADDALEPPLDGEPNAPSSR